MAAYVVPLADCLDLATAGGKAVGLARLIRAGFPVPAGLCVTTTAYLATLHAAGLDVGTMTRWVHAASAAERKRRLSECRQRIVTVPLPAALIEDLRARLPALRTTIGEAPRWAIRSSAPHEDGPDRTYAGMYRTCLNVTDDGILDAIRTCWGSVWDSRAYAYAHAGEVKHAHTMAVIVQPLLSPIAAGVAYSRHPRTGAVDLVVVNAVAGLGDRLVAGTVTPDAYTVRMESASGTTVVVDRTTAPLAPKSDASNPLITASRPVLSDEQVLALAALVKDVERALHDPVDVEWALTHAGWWVLQARAIPAASCVRYGRPQTVWSRANFKETLPDVPSPLGLSFLIQFMEVHMLSHYRDLGCVIPVGTEAVRIFRSRPYLNVTLFQDLAAQLGSDPQLVIEHMGGEPTGYAEGRRLPWWKLIRAAIVLKRKLSQAVRHAPRWFAEMKQLSESNTNVAALWPSAILNEITHIGSRLAMNDLTFAIVAGVSQHLYLLRTLLQRRLGAGWRAELNAVLQTTGAVVSARQIERLHELARRATREEAAVRFFLDAEWQPKPFRSRLAGSGFLEGFERYLAEYGHRALGESDVASPRFAEDPTPLLTMVRQYLMSRTEPPRAETGELEDCQRAYKRLLHSFGWRLHERVLFAHWHRRLVRFLSLREENRHHLMYLTATLRRFLLQLGSHYTHLGVFTSPDDIFYLDVDELEILAAGGSRPWQSLIASRRAAEAVAASQPAPDTLRGTAMVPSPISSKAWHGLSLSTGTAQGPARLVLSSQDFSNIHRGDIIVTPVLDPGMVALFGLAAGIVVEMGGVLSHGAIVAREYGIPAVANIAGATAQIRDGEEIRIDADHGRVERLAREVTRSARGIP